MGKKYTGTIVEESLEDNRILNNFEIIGFKISEDENPADRWHLYKVKLSDSDIRDLSGKIKPKKWYAHFWKDNEIKAVFKDKIFTFRTDDKNARKEVIGYGLSIGIPAEQLDFIIE